MHSCASCASACSVPAPVRPRPSPPRLPAQPTSRQWSRAGRVDLAEPSLARVHAASLFIVGSRDLEVLELNRAAAARLQCEHQLVVVPGASRLFEEHGTLEVAPAGDWFVRHLV